MKSNPNQLAHDLRHGSDAFLENRRATAGLALLSIGSLALVALYQMGLFRRLPQPSLPLFDTEKTNGSDEAYALLGVPDAVLGLGSYAATLGLAAMGGRDRAHTAPLLPLALAAKSLVDAVEATRLSHRSWTKHRAFSIYSLVVLCCTLATLPRVLPEAWAAFKEWRRRCR
jgi:hypothetical protein